MYDTFTISTAQYREIIALNEGHYHDLKSKEISPAKLSRSISALANASGGELFVGISEFKEPGETKRIWDGFEIPEHANGLIQAIQQSRTIDDHYEIAFLRHPSANGLVLHIDVRKSPRVIYATDKHPYVRRSAQCLRVDTHEDLQQLLHDKGLQSYEDTPVNERTETISESETLYDFLASRPSPPEPEVFLTKQRLVVDNKPTVAGLLLYADEPAASLPKRCSIKISRYKTTDLHGTRETMDGEPTTIEGPICELIFRAVDETKRAILGTQVMRAGKLQQVEYPTETLHEIIANSVLHRDYSRTTDVQVRIFDNRVEVESPGKLPATVTVENILDTQFARNPRIVRLANKFATPPNKDMGEGLNTAYKAMEKMRLKPPVIEERDDTVLVTIKHERLASPEEAVMEYLQQYASITNSTARLLTGIASENKMKEVFYRLRDSKQIEQVPDLKGNKSAWRRVSTTARAEDVNTPKG